MGQVLNSFGNHRRALVIGSSGGIGSAIAGVLRQDASCDKLETLSRVENGFDLLDERSIADHAGRLGTAKFNMIICATGALTIGGIGPEKSIRQISPDAMLAQFAINAVGPALILKHFTPLLAKEERAVFAFLSARVGSIGDNRLGGWISYRSSKAALNQIVHTAAIEISRSHPKAIVAAVHPGTVETALSEPYGQKRARTDPKVAAQQILATFDGLRPENTGGFFAYDGSAIAW